MAHRAHSCIGHSIGTMFHSYMHRTIHSTTLGIFLLTLSLRGSLVVWFAGMFVYPGSLG